uniref:Uncharacterized protein n=1 Tax=Rhizophora mucronata TaxID=61149 RepID=A0A2P2KDH2_RHIMU
MTCLPSEATKRRDKEKKIDSYVGPTYSVFVSLSLSTFIN